MINCHMANLAAGSRFAAQKAIFDDESRADTGTNCEKSQRVGALPGTEAMFCKCGCIGIVFEANGDAIKRIAQRRGKWVALSPAWQCGGGQASPRRASAGPPMLTPIPIGLAAVLWMTFFPREMRKAARSFPLACAGVCSAVR